jgi:hypothetical protein
MKLQTQLAQIERKLGDVAHLAIFQANLNTSNAFEVAQRCTEICETAAMIIGRSREAMGRKDAKKRLVKKVRTALGFVYP